MPKDLKLALAVFGLWAFFFLVLMYVICEVHGYITF